MSARDEALDQVVSIARKYSLSVRDIVDALESVAPDKSETSASQLSRILGFLGGTFIFSGLGVFIALNWDIMNAAARIIITLGSGIAAFIMALTASSDPRYVKARTPLYLIAAVLQPTGILVTINEFSSGGNWRYAALLTAGVMTIQQGAVFWSKRDTTLLFTTVAFVFWFFGTILDLLGAEADFISFVLGASIVGICIGLEGTKYRALNPFWYFIGSVSFLGGLFTLIQDTAIELAFLAAACAGVFLSTYVRSRVLLFVSTIAILSYISYFTSKYFLDSLGWPLVLIFLGITLIVLSSVSMRISRRYIKPA